MARMVCISERGNKIEARLLELTLLSRMTAVCQNNTHLRHTISHLEGSSAFGTDSRAENNGLICVRGFSATVKLGFLHLCPVYYRKHTNLEEREYFYCRDL
jgi:hypothetical protein